MEYEEQKDLTWLKEAASKALRSKICSAAIFIGLASSAKDVNELAGFINNGDILHSISESFYIGTELAGTVVLASLSIKEHRRYTTKDFLQSREQGIELQAGQTFYPREPGPSRL